MEDTKTIELRNGLAHGQRIAVAPNATFILLPFDVGGVVSLYDYRQTHAWTEDGVEVWIYEPWAAPRVKDLPYGGGDLLSR